MTALNDAEWFKAHAEYLKSEAWRRKANLVIKRDNYVCHAQLTGCRVGATQVHHLTYRHWRNEPLFDLVAVCSACHKQITEMDRARRGISIDDMGVQPQRLVVDDDMGNKLRVLLARSAASK